MIAAAGLAVAGAGPVAAAPKPHAPAASARVILPPTLCRIWFRGLPADQQPRPMDCRAARRQAAISGGQVIVGNAEPGGAFRFDESADRYRREANARSAEEQERSLRDRDWRDRTSNAHDWRDDDPEPH